MLTKDFETQKQKMMKCIKYRDFDTAIYICMYLSQFNVDFTLLSCILLYENKEYSRSMNVLKTELGVTGLYYKVLCLKMLKEYSLALEILNTLVEGRTPQERISDPFVSLYVLSSYDTEFFDSLLGELYILKGNCHFAIEKYRKSFFKNPLLNTCFGLHDENIFIAPINDHSNDLIYSLYHDLFKFNIQNDISVPIPSNINELIEQYPFFQYYFSNSPGYGSYFISRIASLYSRYSLSTVGNQIFQYLRSEDRQFIKEMEVYSTDLWVNKELNLLGLLSKELIESAPDHHITWAVVGNYYSLKNMAKESCSCLIKSLGIYQTHYVYTLLGYENDACRRLLEASNFYRISYSMLENNDRAYLGMGAALSELDSKAEAELYFKKALKLNMRNLNMRALITRFYIKYKPEKVTIGDISKFLGMNCETFKEITDCILKRAGTFTQPEELIILELVGLLVKYKEMDFARNILEIIECRTKSYFSKKCLLQPDIS